MAATNDQQTVREVSGGGNLPQAVETARTHWSEAEARAELRNREGHPASAERKGEE